MKRLIMGMIVLSFSIPLFASGGAEAVEPAKAVEIVFASEAKWAGVTKREEGQPRRDTGLDTHMAYTARYCTDWP